jgi:hypothetical protein
MQSFIGKYSIQNKPFLILFPSLLSVDELMDVYLGRLLYSYNCPLDEYHLAVWQIQIKTNVFINQSNVPIF